MGEPRLDIVGLGLATLDVLIRLGKMPTWEHGAAVSGFALDGGGPVGTACCAAARLGARVGFVGTAGNDDIAALKVASLQENGVDTSRLVVRDGPENQVVIVHVHEGSGERVFSGLRGSGKPGTPARSPLSTAPPCSRVGVPTAPGLRGFGAAPLTVEELDRDYVTSARFLHLDGTHGEAALQAARWMREAGGEVVLDCAKTDGRPAHEGLRRLLRDVDILIGGSGCGLSLTGREDPSAAGAAMLDLGPRVVVQTEGAQGSYTTTTAEHFHTPAFAVEVLDTTGAGDVFHGAYLVGLLHGWDLPTVARFATAVAAIKCTRLGGRRGVPTMDDTLAFLQERGFTINTES